LQTHGAHLTARLDEHSLVLAANLWKDQLAPNRRTWVRLRSVGCLALAESVRHGSAPRRLSARATKVRRFHLGGFEKSDSRAPSIT
jgi:hypothetical protein